MMTTLTLAVAILLSFFTFALADNSVEENLKLYPNWIGVDAQGLPTTMPIFTYATSGSTVINEAVWVEVPCDTDRDGIRDRVSVYIRRPNAPGFKSPAVMEFSPYHEGSNVGYSRMSAYINSADDHLRALAETLRYHDNYPLVMKVNPDTTDKTYDDIKFKGSEPWDPIWLTIGAFTPISWYTDPVPAPTTPTEYADVGSTPPSYSAITRHQQYFVRGYAMLFGQLLGSRSCTGITSTMHTEEWLSSAAVAMWLRGDAQAFTTRNGTIAVKCTWSNGNIAMDGTSYPGTTPLLAAMTGVPGVKAIMTEANPGSQYDYYRASGSINCPGGYGGEDMNLHASYNFTRFNGDATSGIPPAAGPNFDLAAQKAYIATQQFMMKEQDRDTGDYNAEWDIRNLLRGLGHINPDVGVLQTSGLMDWNVNPKHAFGMLQGMRDKYQGYNHKYVGGLTTHASQNSRLVPGKDGVERGMLKWYLMFMDHHMLGLDNKVNELMYDVNIPHNITGVMEGYDYDPAVEERGTILPGTTYQKIYLTSGPEGKAGRLSYNAPAASLEHFADMDIHAQLESPTPQGTTAITGTNRSTVPTSTDGNKRVNATQAAFCEDRVIGVSRTSSSLNNLAPFDYIDKPINGRLMYISEPLTERLLMSGSVSIHLNAAPDRGMGTISAAVMEIGRKARSDSGRASISASTTGSTVVFPAAGGVSASSATRYANPVGSTQSNYKWVTWGHTDVQNPSYDNKLWYEVPEQNYIPNFYFQTTKIVPGQYYNYTIELNPYNYVFDVGTRIAIMVFGTDPNYTPLLTPECTAAFDVKLGDGSYAKIPLKLAEPKDSITIEAGSIDDTQNGNVARGKEGKVPYSISDNSLGFSSLELALPFRSGVYAPVDVTPSALLSGATLIYSVDGDTLNVKIAADKNIAGDGELFTVTYKVDEAAPYGFSNSLGVNVVSAKFDSFMDKVIDVEVETVPGVLVTAFAPITSIRIDAPASMTVERGKTYDFGAILNANTTDAFLEWSINNKAYATINNAGLVTILNKTGTAVLTVKDPLGGMSFSVILRIV